jgi:hypothetical protein
MKKQINEIKRMQQLAKILTESQLSEEKLTIVDGREVLDHDGIFIYADPLGNSGLFITTDPTFDAGDYEIAGDQGEININGKIFKWAVIYS